MQGKEYLVPSDLITWMQKATPGENGAFLIPEQREDLMRRAEDMFYGHQEAYDDMTERILAQAEQDNISGPEIMGEGPYQRYLERRSKKKEFEHETRFQAPTQQDLEDEKQQAINAKEEEISSWEARQAENAFKRTEAGKVKQFVENTGIPTRYVGFNRKLKRWEYFDPQENKRVPVPIEFDEKLLNSWLKKFNISDSDLTFDEEKGQIGYYDKKAKKYHVPPFKAKYTPRLFQVWLNKYGITEDDIQYSVKDSAFGWLDEKTGKFHKVPFKLD